MAVWVEDMHRVVLLVAVYAGENRAAPMTDWQQRLRPTKTRFLLIGGPKVQIDFRGRFAGVVWHSACHAYKPVAWAEPAVSKF